MDTKITDHKYSTPESSMEHLPEAYVRGFYFRPDGDHGWEEFKEVEAEKYSLMKESLRKLNKMGVYVSQMIQLHSPGPEGRWELMIIWILKEIKGVDLLQGWDPGLKWASGNLFADLQNSFGEPECCFHFELFGVETMKIIINECY